MPTIHHGDCIETMNAMPPESVDAIVTDPPYGLGFMGKKWDGLPPSLEWAEACYRVLKPGGHIAAFGGTRTWHRLAVAIEDAGFEMRDSLAWLYGSGFPKSHDVGKAIDKAREDSSEWRAIGKALRSSREAAGYRTRRAFAPLILDGHKNLESAAANLSNWENGLSFPTWERWQSLKAILSLPDDMDAEVWRLNSRKGTPSENWDKREITGHHEAGNPIGVYEFKHGGGKGRTANERRDIPATPDAERWQGWGTALKPAFEPIVLARKPLAEKTVARNVLAYGTGAINVDACRIGTDDDIAKKYPNGPGGTTFGGGAMALTGQWRQPSGRWPANVLLDQHAAAWVDEQSGDLHTQDPATRASRSKRAGVTQMGTGKSVEYDDRGGPSGASRFFYTAKAPKRERPNVDGVQHPTVKPLAIMRWLIRLVTPPGGTVLDPFAGSGTTIEAALIEGFDPVGIEMETDYLPLIQHRIDRQAGTLTA